MGGRFWHGCPKHANMPANNRTFWKKKLTGNKQRDRLVTRQLRRQGWTVIRIWEHELAKTPARCLKRIQRAFRYLPRTVHHSHDVSLSDISFVAWSLLTGRIDLRGPDTTGTAVQSTRTCRRTTRLREDYGGQAAPSGKG